MTPYERGYAAELKAAAEVCKAKWNDAERIAAQANHGNDGDGWELAEQTAIHAAHTASEECAEQILSLPIVGEADQRGAAAEAFSPSGSQKHTAQSAPHHNPGEQGSESSRSQSVDSSARESVADSPARPGPSQECVMVPKKPTEKMLAAVREVVDEIPPYIGLTGNALNEQVWKAINAMLAAREE